MVMAFAILLRFPFRYAYCIDNIFHERHVILLSDEQCLWVLCTSTAPLTALGGSGGIIFHFKGSFKLRFYQGPCKDIFFRKINLALPDLCRVSLHHLIF